MTKCLRILGFFWYHSPRMLKPNEEPKAEELRLQGLDLSGRARLFDAHRFAFTWQIRSLQKHVHKASAKLVVL